MLVITLLTVSTALGFGFTAHRSLDPRIADLSAATRCRARTHRRRRRAAKKASRQAGLESVGQRSESPASGPWLYEFATQLKSIF